jgi:hypothetical protein
VWCRLLAWSASFSFHCLSPLTWPPYYDAACLFSFWFLDHSRW